ncbi:MAG: adenine deaminase [Rhodocyclaceae bacterium]|nr:adenine deaminase [Rhodocyclaceae bacterium]
MTQASGRIAANIVDIEARSIRSGAVAWKEGIITGVELYGEPDPGLPYLMPGFIDAHVHIESAMLVPSEFARLAVRHGTVAAVSDPHEIANVLGVAGVRFMLDNAAQTPFHILFGAPSCVPATSFETAGAALDSRDVEKLLDDPRVGYLSEMMNFPGVLSGDPEVMAKIKAARSRGLPVDGHAPGLTGEAARRYAAAGIGTDHECFSLPEAEDKIAAGMHILIREGSAARNFDALHPLISRHSERLMFCSDDKHPDDLAAGHINQLVARAVALGHDLFHVLAIACLNPVAHYRLPVGRLRIGDAFDAVLVQDLVDFQARATYLSGVQVAESGHSLLPCVPVTRANRWRARRIAADDLELPAHDRPLRVIQAFDGELVTRELRASPNRSEGRFLPDPEQDLLFLLVLNRYQPAAPALAFIRGFGLKRGALASSVAHDSHNLVAVGANLDDLLLAVNRLVDCGGGIAVADSGRVESLALPVAGLMSDADGDTVATRYAELNALAHGLGGGLRAPFMTLSFMALLVIPELKLSDQGLFDGRTFGFVGLET